MTTGKAVAVYAAISLVIVGVGGWLLGIVFTSPPEHRAIRVSAGLAIAVQLVGFLVARRSAPSNLIAGWGAAMLLRVATLFVYALIVIGRLGLPSSAALLSLATFFFVSTLVEPPLLKT